MSSDTLLVPEGSRLVHIGPHKTGSTAIQGALHEARAALEEHGVHYAGAGVRPRQAGWALGIAGRKAGTPVPPMRHWDELVRDVRDAGPRRVCVSNEDFGRATPEQTKKVVGDLGGDAVHPVHVVAVARRLDRYLPSQWQERVKAGQSKSYEDWLRVVLAEESDAWDWRNVWRAHDTAGLVRRWTAEVGAESFTLIVSDDSDRDLLPRTFEQLLGLPEGLLEPRPDRSNRSLSWSEVELVRSLNQASRRNGWSKDLHDSLVKQQVVRTLRGLPPAQVGPRTPPLPAWALDRVREISDARVEAIKTLGVRVVGDPEVLRVPADLAVGSTSDCPPVPVETAAKVLEAVITAAGGRQRPVRRRKATAPVAAAPQPRRHRVRALAGRVRRRVLAARS